MRYTSSSNFAPCISPRTLWGDCSTCRDDGSADWQCPALIEVYNDLLGNPDGTEASVIETDGGSGML